MSAPVGVQILLLSLLAGTLGAWVVLRRLAFYSHAVGTAAFPGLVIAAPLGVAAPLAGLGSALLAALGVRGLRGLPRLGPDAATGLVLAAALAVGAIAATEEVHVEELLFGALTEVGWGEVAFTAAAAVLVLAAEAARRRSWLADGLDGRAPDLVLLVAVAVAVIAAVDAVGALLVGAILVMPAATARLVTRDVRDLRRVAASLALAELFAAVLVAEALDTEAGAALAVIAGIVFAGTAILRGER